MKDILGKLTELEATAPKAPAGKKMLNEDSTTPPINVSNKPASLKDIFETLAVGQKPIPVVGKQGDQQETGAGFLNVTDNSPAAQALSHALGDLAQQKKVQIVVPTGQQPAQQGQPQAGVTGQPQPGQQQMKEKDEGKPGKNFAKIAKSAGKRYGSKEAGERVAGAVRAKLAKQGKLEEEQLDEKFASQQQAKLMYATAGGADTGVSKKVAKEFIKKSHGQKVGKLPKKKTDEADIPSTQGVDTKGAGLGAGRSMTTLEGKKAKPDFLDMDKDGNKEEPMKKAIKDKKKTVKEGLSSRITAARHEGRADGLRAGKNRFRDYEDLEEARAYHEGYKDGLDECYGQGVYETAPAMPAATVPGMANAAMPTMEDDMEEGNAFTAALAKTPKGGKFSVGGKSFTDRSSYDSKLGETDYAFESWDRELQSLLTESEAVSEGLSVSVSKGQQNSPDSVTITAQDAEADQLLQLVKHAGLGLFGDDHAEPSQAMSVQPAHGAPDEVGAGGVDIDVVDGSDDMLSLMQKLGGVEASGHDEEYADEEGDEEHTCNECGMMETQCGCGDKDKVEEVESEDQMEYEVAEDNAPDSGAEDSVADEDAEAKEDAALAGEKEEEMNESFFDLLGRLSKLAESKEEDEEDVTEAKEEDEEEDEEDVTEGLNEWANQVGKGPGKGTDASFERDIEFMTKVIAGGLNKPKSTGQTTIPVIAGQEDRMHDNPSDWATLAGIKK